MTHSLNVSPLINSILQFWLVKKAKVISYFAVTYASVTRVVCVGSCELSSSYILKVCVGSSEQME